VICGLGLNFAVQKPERVVSSPFRANKYEVSTREYVLTFMNRNAEEELIRLRFR